MRCIDPATGTRSRGEILEDSRSTLRQAERILALLVPGGGNPDPEDSVPSLVMVRREVEGAVRVLHRRRDLLPPSPTVEEVSAELLDDVEARLHRALHTLAGLTSPPASPATWGTSP